MTRPQLLSERFNKLIEDFEKRNKCIIKELNFKIVCQK